MLSLFCLERTSWLRFSFGLLLAALLTTCLAAAAVAPAEFWVDPLGDDAAAGTPDKPFATFARAQQAARRQGASKIWFRTGIYYLPETVHLTASDNGSKYAAAPGQQPVLSGGMKLDLDWQSYRDGIQQAKTPAGLAIDQLFVGGKRQFMARYPNFDPTVRPYGGYSADAFGPARAAGWANPAGGFIHAMHGAHWGGYHYRITGKNAQGEVVYEGGWQNNRQSGMHPQHRYVENIFEELDAPGEWFHDAKTATLYYQPAAGVDLKTAAIEVVRLRHLVEFNGSRQQPVQNVSLHGFVFRHAARTFMDVKEPLLRSDWTIYRGGALLFDGAEDCAVEDCELNQMGGNAVFVNNYNRRVTIRGCDIHDTGGSAVAFVGSPQAVRNPLFEYGRRQNYADISKIPGPRTDDYPADCLVDDCLIRGVGVVEKQATGVELSMAGGITVRHCSIYEASRAGINISEGTFGGHLIELCDVFDTVLETGDHGSFNSWGRDRYWHLGAAPEAELPALALLDMVKPNILRNNRWRCDHGWDVDLDDGSSNYEITNNVFLAGGLKLREGYHRKVWNNIAVNNSLHPHVWFENSDDEVMGNIWMGAYRPAAMSDRLKQWGRQVDRNLFTTTDADRTKFADKGCDAHSLVGDPRFVDPAKGDFRVEQGSPALEIGFVNFPMDRFGVKKPALKSIARTPQIHAPKQATTARPSRPSSWPVAAALAPPSALAPPATWQGHLARGLEGEEFSAYGVSKESGGVVLLSSRGDSPVAAAGIKAQDVIQSINGKPVRSMAELIGAVNTAAGQSLAIGLVRSQTPQQIHLNDYTFMIAEAAANADFKILPLAVNALPVASVAAQPATRNEPVGSLLDGKVAANYGPVFANTVEQGVYKVDLGKAITIGEVRTWSFNQNANRGTQRFILFGSAADSDPGWNTAISDRFTPIVEVLAPTTQHYLATSIRRAGDRPLGTFRWLVWAASPVSAQGENTAYQELQVFPSQGQNVQR